MTIREAMLSAARLPVLGLLFLLLAAQMTILIAAFRDGRSRRFTLAVLSSFLTGTVLFLLCLSGLDPGAAGLAAGVLRRAGPGCLGV